MLHVYLLEINKIDDKWKKGYNDYVKETMCYKSTAVNSAVSK